MSIPNGCPLLRALKALAPMAPKPRRAAVSSIARLRGRADRAKSLGLATLCHGTGGSTAVVVERVG